ncbi:MAG: transposase family protein [Leptospirales bacterium]
MRLNMNERRTLVKVFAEKYRKARKKVKGILLDEFIELTGYNRSYATRALRDFKPVRAVRKKRPARIKYDSDVRLALEKIWAVLDYVCGKRLVAVLPEVLEKLIKLDEISVSRDTRRKLLSISSATADRLLAGARDRLGRNRNASKNPRRHLFSQIPIKTFGEWKDVVPGFVQMDLVAHNGGNVNGGHLWTLNTTDVASGWTIATLVSAKSEFQMMKGIYRMKRSFPFPLRGLHTDNGSEFVNGTVMNFCRRYQIEFTRSRPYRKNDACYIEQRNNTIVRRNVGYFRYEKQHQAILAELYRNLNLYSNFFQPVMMLVSKKRYGAKVYRKYDKPQTPYQRLLSRGTLTRTRKRQLKALYDSLNPAELRRQIDRLQNELIGMEKPRPRKKLKTERQRRPKRVSNTAPGRRREDDTTNAANTFMDRMRLFRLKNDLQKLWDKRDAVSGDAQQSQ